MLSCWGFGKDGRLGTNSEKDLSTPALVLALAGLNIVDIACGAQFTLALTDTGKVFSWGSGKSGECGGYY